jgi:hypothetical protein
VQRYDRYAYVNNSPLNYTDPSGHCTKTGYKNKIITDDECEATPPFLIFETEGNRTWTQREKDVLNAGAQDVANAIARDINSATQRVAEMEGDPYPETISPEMAFKKAYNGPVKVVRKAGTCAETIGYAYPGCGGWGYSNTRDEIWIFDNATPSIIIAYPRLIVHELGHSFDKASGMSSDMPNDTKNRNGFYGPNSSWQLSTDMADTEIYADMFVGWVYGKWQRDNKGYLTADAAAKSAYMSNTASYINMAMGGYI